MFLLFFQPVIFSSPLGTWSPISLRNRHSFLIFFFVPLNTPYGPDLVGLTIEKTRQKRDDLWDNDEDYDLIGLANNTNVNGMIVALDEKKRDEEDGELKYIHSEVISAYDEWDRNAGDPPFFFRTGINRVSRDSHSIRLHDFSPNKLGESGLVFKGSSENPQILIMNQVFISWINYNHFLIFFIDISQKEA